MTDINKMLADILEKLTIRPDLLGFMVLNFLVLVVILRFILLKPLSRAIEERQKKINAGLDNAVQMEKKMKEFEEDYEEKMKDVKAETKKIIEEAKMEGKKLREEELEKAQGEASRMMENAKGEIEKTKQSLKQEVKSELGDIIGEVVTGFLKTEISSDQKKKLLEDAIKELEK